MFFKLQAVVSLVGLSLFVMSQAKCNPINLNSWRHSPDSRIDWQPRSLQNKKRTLRYWANKFGVQDIIDASEDDKYNVLLNSQFECRITNELIDDLNNMDETDKLLFADVYTNRIIQNQSNLQSVGAHTQHHVAQWVNTVVPNGMEVPNGILNPQLSGNVFYDTPNSHINRASLRLMPVGNHSDPFWPSNKWWMKIWLRNLHGQIGINTIKELIADCHDNEINEIQVGTYCPPNYRTLNELHMKYASHTPMIHIVKKQGGYKSSYDSFVNDLKIWYATDRIRHSMMCKLSEFVKLKKANPLYHGQQQPNGIVHPCQTRFARRPLFMWLEEVVFIIDKYDDSKWPVTIAIVPGTFIWNKKSQLYGLVTGVNKKYWSLNFMKDKITKLVTLAENWFNDTEKFVKEGAQTVSNSLHPMYSLEIIRLHWKYENCKVRCHTHSTLKEQCLFLNLHDDEKSNDLGSIQNNQMDNFIQTVQVSDDLSISELWIGQQQLLMADFNKDDYPCNRPSLEPWCWRFVMSTNTLFNPLCVDWIRDFLYNLIDPFERLMPGIDNPDLVNSATVFVGQFNTDGFGVFNCENSLMPKNHLSQNYISCLHCLTSKNLLVSVGLTTETGDNSVWLDCFITDVIRSIFLGIDCVYVDNRGIQRMLTVFGIIANFLVDGAEVKTLTGIAGANNARSDYYTSTHRDESVWNNLHQPERHYKVLITQSHINYLNQKLPLLAMLAENMDVQIRLDSLMVKPRPTKIKQRLSMIFQAAGLSAKMSPKIARLPTLSLIKVEFSHMMYHHLLPLICQAVKCTHYGLKTNPAMKCHMEMLWHCMMRNPHYPKMVSTTYFRNSTVGSQVTLKAVNVYLSSLILGYNGVILGFDPVSVNILRRVLRWNGIFLSGCLRTTDLFWLKNECLDICALIEEQPHFIAAIGKSHCLRIWRNLINIDLYQWAMPEHFVGLMYDSQHRHSLNHLRLHSKRNAANILISHNNKQRVIKDVLCQALGWNPTDEYPLGHGISNLMSQIGFNSSLVKKCLQYTWIKQGNNECDWQLQEIEHITTMKLKPMTFDKWYEIVSSFDGRQWNKNMLSVQPDRILKYAIDIAHAIVNENTCQGSDTPLSLFNRALQQNEFDMFVCSGFQTLYYSYLDSHLRLDDTCWIRKHLRNWLMDIQLVLVFKHLTQSQVLTDHLNTDLTDKNLDYLILLIGQQWKSIVTPGMELNFETFDIDDVPVVTPTEQVSCVSAEYVVQQMLIQHDHIIPAITDMTKVSQLIDGYPSIELLQFDMTRNYHYQDDDDQLTPNICGLVIGNDSETLHAQCKFDLHPFFKAYSAFQGYLPRLASSKTINETHWS